MSCPSIVRCLLLSAGLTAVGGLLKPLLAQDQPAGKDQDQSKQRLALMEQTIAGFEAASEEIAARSALTFAAKPLLRYSDPTRGTTEANVLLDASVWRLGEKGRPTALVTLEIYRASEEKSILAYEFLSLSEATLSLTHKVHEKVVWEAAGKALVMTPLADAPKPAASPAARLAQMRQLSRRFKAREKIKDADIECRLLSQPIDRYQSAEDRILDGALFVYANGTNPEVGVLLECSDAAWSCGFARLSSAETKVELDGKEVAHFLHGDFGLKRQGNYVSASHAIGVGK